MASRELEVQGVRDGLSARGALRLRKLLRPARGRLRLLRARPGRGEAARSRPDRRGSGATPTSCPSTSRPGDPLEPGLTPLLRADRLAERLGLEPRSGSRTTPPTRPTPSRTGSSRSPSPRRGSSASRPSPAPRPATSPTPSPPTPPPPASTPTSSSPPTSRSRSCSRPASTGPTWSASAATTTTSTGSAPSSPRPGPGPSSTSTCGPTTREGSKTLAYETVEQLGWELPDRVVCPIASGSLFTKLGRGFQEWLDLGLVEGEQPIFNGAQAEGCSPVATAFAEGWDVCKPQRPETIAKSLAIGDPADGPTRSSRPAAPGRRSTRSPTTRSATGSACWPRRPGSSPRPPAASPSASCAKLAERGEHRRRRAGRRLHHRRGPEDARRDPR